MLREELLTRLKQLDEDAYLHFDNETKFSALNNRRYLEFKSNYDEYVERYRLCGN